MNATSHIVAAGLAAAAFAVSADTVNTWQTSTGGASPATALSWSDAANWSLGHVPTDAEAITFDKPSAKRFIRLPDDVTLWRVTGHNNVIFVGEKVGLSSLAGGNTPKMYTGWYFADVTMQAQKGSWDAWLGDNIQFCGRLLAPYGNLVPAGGWTFHRLDRYATSPDPLRTDDVQIGGNYVYYPGDASLGVYVAGAEASASTWKTTQGSPYVSRVSETADPVAAGARVTGAGIPEGAYVRRIFTDTEMELSVPAAETSDAAELNFAAFHPDARIHVRNYKCQGKGGSSFKLCRRYAADALTFEIDSYSGNSLYERFILGVPSNEIGTYLPGTLVLHDVLGVEGHRPDVLENVHVLLAGALDGGPTVFGENHPISFESSAYEARFTVTNDMTASIANFTNFTGTLVKDGTGSLAVGIADAQNAGGIRVEAGTLELSARDSAGGGALSFGSLEMSAGAVLVVPDCGVRVAKATFAKGAIVEGPGTLTVLDGEMGGATVRNGGHVAHERGSAQTDAYTYKATAQVAGHPAFWVDASKTDSFVLENEDGVDYVRRWNDCREGEPLFATNVVRRPVLVRGDSMETTYVKISHVETHWYTNTEGLVWSQPVNDICAVFLVQDPSDGGGDILGRTSRLPNDYYGSQGGPYYRGTYCSQWQGPLIAPDYATARVKNGRFFLNGTEVVGHKSGYLGAFMQVIEHHCNLDYRAGSKSAALCCDAFGTDGYLDGHQYNYANGYQRIAECIIYTNALTHAERVQTALYLSRKWLGKDISYADVDAKATLDAVTANVGEAIAVPENEVYGVACAEGATALEKDGAGLLVVDSLVAGAVKVNAGELRVKTLSLANDSVPEGAWIHVDADAADTFTLGADGLVQRWEDLGGNELGYRPLTGSPKRKTGVLNGRSVVDCGTMNGADKGSLILSYADQTILPHTDKDNYITGAPYLRTVFVVFGSKGGGNSILGCFSNGFPWQGFANRPDGTSDAMFMVWTGGYEAFRANERSAFSNGTEIVRLNGAWCDPFVTPFSGKYDLLTVSGNYWNRKSDSLATFGQGWNNYAGGLEYGEVIIYPQALPETTLPKVEAYLNKKWFDRDTPGYRLAACTSLVVAQGAQMTVSEWSAARGGAYYEMGTGSLTTGALGGGGTIAGDVVLAAADGAEWIAEAADGAIPGLTLNGTLMLPAACTVRVTGDVANVAPGTYALVTATKLAASEATTWTVDAPARPRRVYRVAQSGNAVTLTVAELGTTIIVR